MSQRLRYERATTTQNESKWRMVGFIVGGIICAALLVGTIGLVLILHTTPPPLTHTDSAAAQRFQQEIQLAQAAAANSKPGVVSADEIEVNSILKEYLTDENNKTSTNSDAVLRDMKTSLPEDRLRLYLLVNLRGRDLTFVLAGTVRSADGFLDFEPINARIGSLSMPKASPKRALEQMVARTETRS